MISIIGVQNALDVLDTRV